MTMKIFVVIPAMLLLGLGFFVAGCVANCDKDLISSRSHLVDPKPLFDEYFPVTAGFPFQFLEYEPRFPPKPESTEIFVSQYDSIQEADSVYEHLCQNGWTDEDWNSYGDENFSYWNEGNNRYCASHTLQPRRSVEYLCEPTGRYNSFVIYQKEKLVVAIYESTMDEKEVGSLTNEALRKWVDELNNTANMDQKSKLIQEILIMGAGKRNLSNVDLSGANLSGLDEGELNKEELDSSILYTFEGPDFSEAILRESNLSDTILVGADMSSVDFRRANLQRADLRQAFLGQSNLEGADLRGANLIGASFGQARLHGAIMDETTKIDEKWHLVWEIVNHGASGRDLTGADLQYANLCGADLSSADLSEANLKFANLVGASLVEADLRGAELRDIRVYENALPEHLKKLCGEDLKDADLSGVKE